MFRAQFGGNHGPHQGGHHGPQNPLSGLIAILPVIGLLLFMFMSQPGEPVRSCTHSRQQVLTAQHRSSMTALRLTRMGVTKGSSLHTVK